MNDSTDKMMQLWLSIPESREPFVQHRIKDLIGDFDVRQPAMRGIAVAEDGHEIPFFSLIVEVILRSEGFPEVSNLTVFRQDKWRVTLNPGFKPSFRLGEEEFPDILHGIKSLLAGRCLNNPTAHMHMVKER